MDQKNSTVDFFLFIILVLNAALLYIFVNLENPALFDAYSLADKLNFQSTHDSLEIIPQTKVVKEKDEPQVQLRYYPAGASEFFDNQIPNYFVVDNGIVTIQSDFIESSSFSGEKQWAFKGAINQKLEIIGPWQSEILVLLDDKRLIGLDLKSGRPVRQRNIDFVVDLPIFTVGTRLLYFSKDNSSILLMELDFSTGEVQTLFNMNKMILANMKLYKNEQGFALYNDEKIMFFSFDKKTIVFNQAIPHPIKSIIVQDNSLYIANSFNELKKFDLKTSEEKWRVKVRYPGVSFMSVDTKAGRVAVLSKNEYLQVFDTESGQSKWRLNTFNESPIQFLSTLKLTSLAMQKINSEVELSGHVFLTTCGENKFCLINPGNGLILSRIRYENQKILSPPIVQENEIYFFSRSDGQHKLLKMHSNSREAQKLIEARRVSMQDENGN